MSVVAGRKCLRLGGGCVDRRKNRCSGKYLTGHCGGDDNMKCCIPKSTCRTTVLCSQVSMCNAAVPIVGIIEQCCVRKSRCR